LESLIHFDQMKSDIAKTEQTKQRFHHRHLPNFTRLTKFIWWKFSHLYFPIWIHFMTDKYEGRRHHLVVDIIYSVVTFILIAVNLAMGIWYYLYFVPADLELQIVTTSEVVSGEPMHVNVIYSNPGRDLKQATMDIYLPEGYIPGEQHNAHSLQHVELGSLPSGSSGVVTISGVVFGDIGETYDVRIIADYQSAGRTFYEAATHHFSVLKSSFELGLELPKAVVYGEPVEGTLVLINHSIVPRKNILLTLSAPAGFRAAGIDAGDSEAALNVFTQQITIPSIAAGQELRIPLTGIFIQPTSDEVVLGDLETEVRISGTSGVESEIIDSARLFDDGGKSNVVSLILPRVVATLKSPVALNFGFPLSSTITVRNAGNSVMQQVALKVFATGSALVPSRATAAVVKSGEREVSQSVTLNDGFLVLPVIEELAVGESATITLSIPTTILTTQNVSASLRVTGSVFAPLVDETIAIPAASSVTKFNSRVELGVDTVYTTPGGEQLGYGPNPPRAWEVTAYRVVMTLRNVNNVIAGTRVTTQLPTQVEWTGENSVSAGTELTYDESTRTVTWKIPALPPQSDAYGAQFEVWLTPNHLQIGQIPAITLDTKAVTTDAFTGSAILMSAGATSASGAVVE